MKPQLITLILLTSMLHQPTFAKSPLSHCPSLQELSTLEAELLEAKLRFFKKINSEKILTESQKTDLLKLIPELLKAGIAVASILFSLYELAKDRQLLSLNLHLKHFAKAHGIKDIHNLKPKDLTILRKSIQKASVEADLILKEAMKKYFEHSSGKVGKYGVIKKRKAFNEFWELNQEKEILDRNLSRVSEALEGNGPLKKSMLETIEIGLRKLKGLKNIKNLLVPLSPYGAALWATEEISFNFFMSPYSPQVKMAETVKSSGLLALTNNDTLSSTSVYEVCNELHNSQKGLNRDSIVAIALVHRTLEVLKQKSELDNLSALEGDEFLKFSRIIQQLSALKTKIPNHNSQVSHNHALGL